MALNQKTETFIEKALFLVGEIAGAITVFFVLPGLIWFFGMAFGFR
ncbi:hypothetical protein [Kiloniella sp.]